MFSDLVILPTITTGPTQNEWVHLEMPQNNEMYLHLQVLMQQKHTYDLYIRPSDHFYCGKYYGVYQK